MSANSSLTSPRPIDVMGLPICPLDIPGLVDLLVDRACNGTRTTGCYANAHTVNLACGNPRFARVLSKCDVLIGDGASVLWASGATGRTLPARLTAMDYFFPLAARCAEAGISMYFLGAADDVAQQAAERVHAAEPRLKIVGACNGHFDLNRSWKVIDRINHAAPNILLVGMSSPRQELWIERYASELHVPVLWCVGALFDYLAGRERRAPAWMCRHHCEWMYRLAMDPLGKWRRYLVGNPLFLWNYLRWRSGMMRPAGLDAPQPTPPMPGGVG